VWKGTSGTETNGNQEGRPVLFITSEIKLRNLIRSEKALRAGCDKPRQTKSQCEFFYIHTMKACVGVAA
jgi:hypothetical protein